MVIQAITQSLLQIVIGGNTSPAVPEAYSSSAPEGLNVLVLILNGGWAMVPVFGLLIIAVYSFLDRFFTISRAGKDNYMLMQNVSAAIQNGSIEDALQICRQQETPAAKMIEKGILRIGRPLSDINIAIDNVGRLEIVKIKRLAPRLANVAVSAVLFGTLGTVMGLIQTFYDKAAAIESKTSVSDALVPAVSGLIVAILAYWGFTILSSKVRKAEQVVAQCSIDFMDMLVEPAK